MRLFAGLALPSDLSARISRLQGGIPEARWTSPENLHVTLTFIGEVQDERLEDVDDALAAVDAPGFELEIKGTGSFAQGEDLKVLWLGIAPNPALHALKERIDNALARYAVPFERRKYVPHVTLARFRRLPDEQKVGDFMQAHNLFAAAFPVDEFILYRSSSGKQGPAYEPLEYYPLGEMVGD